MWAFHVLFLLISIVCRVGGGGNLYDCMGYFKVIAYVLYCIICNVEFSMAC